MAKAGRPGQSDRPARSAAICDYREALWSIATCFMLWQHIAMDMREILMIIGDDEPIAQAITATGPVWIWRAEPPAKGSWHFLTITGESATAIRTAAGGRSGGWGSVRVTATIGQTSWQTSLFPNKQQGGYMLPLKADVRKREGVGDGDEISVMICVD